MYLNFNSEEFVAALQDLHEFLFRCTFSSTEAQYFELILSDLCLCFKVSLVCITF